MTHTILFVFSLIFGAFGLWGQDPEQDAAERRERSARVKAEAKKDRDRVAAESHAVRIAQEEAVRESIKRNETALLDSIARQEATTRAFINRQNSGWGLGWGGGRGGPLYHMPQDGAVAIGERVSPADDILKTGVECVDKLTEKLGFKDAQVYCKEITKEAMKTSGNHSRSARKAVKAPPILVPRYGW